MFNIDKEFDAAYMHRVHSQTLNDVFSLTGTCKCRRLHGHQMKLKIGLQSETLHNGMVTDFNHLAWVKKIVDDVIDHRFIIDSKDPMLTMIFPEVIKFASCIDDFGWYKMFNLDKLRAGLKDEPICELIIEKCSSMVMVDFMPTSENLCKWFFDIASEEMKDFANEEGFRVAYVEFWETPRSHCRYEP